jgi:hypothetical protein
MTRPQCSRGRCAGTGPVGSHGRTGRAGLGGAASGLRGASSRTRCTRALPRTSGRWRSPARRAADLTVGARTWPRPGAGAYSATGARAGGPGPPATVTVAVGWVHRNGVWGGKPTASAVGAVNGYPARAGASLGVVSDVDGPGMPTAVPVPRQLRGRMANELPGGLRARNDPVGGLGAARRTGRSSPKLRSSLRLLRLC